MDFDKFILASKSSFVLKTDEDVETVKLKLVELGLTAREIEKQNSKSLKKRGSKDEAREVDTLAGKVTDNSLEMKENCGYLEGIIQPRLVGKLEEDDDGKARLILVSKPGLLVSYIMEQAGGALAGATIALVASVYLSPNIIPLIYTILISLLLPLIVFTIIIALSRRTAPHSLNRLQEQLEKTFSSECLSGSIEGQESRSLVDSKHTSSPLEKVKAGMVAALLFLAIAFGLHQVAYQFWINGDYKTSEMLCHPVSTISKAFLDKESAVVADTDFYLAECLRCQGKLEEAKAIYLNVLSLYENDIGKEHRFVADVTFNLGRIYEAEGNFKEAQKMYERTQTIWSQTIGKHNILTNRVRDRLAVLDLKRNQEVNALKNLNTALKYDRRYKPSIGAIAVAEDLNDLAVAKFYAGDIEGARKDLKESISILEKLPGEKNDKLAAPLINTIYIELYSELISKDVGKKGIEIDSSIERLNRIMDTQISRDDFVMNAEKPGARISKKLSDAYQKILDKQRPSYEAPTYDTRANVLISLEGRL